MAAYLVTLGDSVHWGQGLLRAHKLHTIVGAEMRKTQPDLVDQFLAHSGATIGVGATVKRQAGHPNVTGARKYADAILSALRLNP